MSVVGTGSFLIDARMSRSCVPGKIDREAVAIAIRVSLTPGHYLYLEVIFIE